MIVIQLVLGWDTLVLLAVHEGILSILLQLLLQLLFQLLLLP